MIPSDDIWLVEYAGSGHRIFGHLHHPGRLLAIWCHRSVMQALQLAPDRIAFTAWSMLCCVKHCAINHCKLNC